MLDHHILFGAASVLLQLVGFALYTRSAFKDGTKPHPFTWLIFATVDGTVFAAQVLHGGGPGAWLLGVTTLTGTALFLLALWRGEKRITRLDWTCLATALAGIVVWQLTGNALYAVLLASVVDIVAKVPTLRKSYIRPHEESLTIWITGTVNFSLSIVALESLSWTTALFPAEIVVTNALLVVLVLARRRQLARLSA